ncbi:seven-hairpin glycosidase [Pseudovirgaria hyperparasitica]|uniref:alpha-1,2-Mannosidase n=1 Tax=Pseudovirgaria hyperparasitica TaxID=470096 RepID=A0A6A6WHS9_9PEZI|nr:seven-hairpin glycosidase [Pseudovirgaria hyperparasitica]KAF2760711.1 seven-hairpin glycosidase [Pseudovirgaria hyperparasitica]
MLRLRRYRVFLFFAIITIFAFYKFSGSSQWQQSSLDPAPLPNKPKPHVEDVEEQTVEVDQLPKPVLNEVVKETKKLDVHVPAAETPQGPLVTPPPVAPVEKPAQTSAAKKPLLPDEDRPVEQPKVPDQGPIPGNLPHAVAAGDAEPETVPPVYWSKQKEHFPLKTESIVQLPTAKPIAVPKIQYAFKKESADQKTTREARLDVVKKEFLWAWKGYKEHAWLHDELKPVTGESKDPFAGWGATLVDSLDTLWIMGLTTEFEDALEGVKKIDFRTTTRDDIPVFETTIRYLGGLLAAYDVSEGKYKILLDKAVELAEVLMGIFDTPNRMPVLYYHWRPMFASQAHRASTNSVLAEIGSLSMEFTRLAQITKEPKYYDAVARITNELEKSQNNTRLPGMWPTYLDASGCKKYDAQHVSLATAEKPETDKLQNQQAPVDTTVSLADKTLTKEDEKMIPDDQKMVPFKRPPPAESTAKATDDDMSSAPQAGNDGRIQGFDGEKVDETSLQRPKPQQHPGPPKDKNPNTPQAGKASQILGMNGEKVDETSLGRLSKPGDVKPNTMSREDDVPEAKLEKNPIAAGADKFGKILGMDGPDEDGTSLGTLKNDPRLPVQEKPLRVQDWDEDRKKDNTLKPLSPGQPGKVAGWNEREEEISGLRKRQLDLEDQPTFEDLIDGVDSSTSPPPVTGSTLEANDKEAPDCIPQGLVPTVSNGRNTFTLGGMSDSTYEYLPKQYLLLGGVVDQYKNMYELAMKAIRKYLIFRPMLPHGVDVLMSGAFGISGRTGDVDVDDGELDPEGAHLTCFVGGMIGMGAKIFGIEPDLKLAEKLTEGCVWAYNSTASGIMPESFRAIPCDDPKDCTWNQTQYYLELDPYAELRRISYLKDVEQYNIQMAEATAKASAAVISKQEAVAQPTPAPEVEAAPALADPAFPADPVTPPSPKSLDTPNTLKKRQLDLDRDEPEMSDEAKTEQANSEADPFAREFKLLTQYITKPQVPLTHEERVMQILEKEGTPLGMKTVNGRSYILRPEAIESVWYMYRITGNEHWREVGWNMFESIIKHTRSDFGHSAIHDILQNETTQTDSMESFWLAETLKYFYLLYSEESLISLDEWVLNTEAHPFKRPLPENVAAS